MAASNRHYVNLPAVNPADGTLWEVRISNDRIAAVGKQSLGRAKECAFIVPEILRNPTAIYEGLRRDEDDPRGAGHGWLCYVGLPDRSFRKDGREAPPWQDEVFLVFVNQDRVAYNWGWEKCGPDQLPEGHDAGRFKRKVL